MIRTAIDMYGSGKSGSEISVRVGRSRSAVIAMLGRLRDAGDSRAAVADAAHAAAIKGQGQLSGRPRDESSAAEAARHRERERQARRRSDRDRAHGAKVEAEVRRGVAADRPSSPCFACGSAGWCRHQPRPFDHPITTGASA